MERSLIPKLVLTAVLVAACGSGPAATTISPSSSAATPTAAPSASALPSDAPASPGERPTQTVVASASVTPTAHPSVTSTPGTLAWTALPSTDGPPAREDHTLTLSGDGESAYLFGGRSGERTFDDIWRYELAAGTWQQLSPEGSVPPGRFGHVAAWREGLGLVIWSGQADASTFFADIWAYDPAAVEWRRLADRGAVPLARYGSCGEIGPDGRLWISHGFTHDEGRFSDTRAYDFATETWTDETPPGDVPVRRCLHDCLWTPDGRLLLYAGQTTGAPAIGDLWHLAPDASGWLQEPQPAPPPRELYALGRLDGRAFVFGGGASDGRLLGDLWLLDLDTLGWSEALPSGASPAPRSGAALVADPVRGRLLLFGGKGRDGELADLWQLRAEP